MLVLAADTSLPILSVALIRDGVASIRDGVASIHDGVASINHGALVGAMATEGRGSRNEKLLPAIDWLLTENNIDRHSVDLFAVTRGPGSFTGVRIGLATMQGLALALGRPVCAMSTHEAIAHGTRGRIAIYDDAGRGELYMSAFVDGVEAIAPRLASAREEAGIDVAEFLQRDNVALRCARRALEIETRGDGERYRDVTPIYVRLAEAEVKLQQKHA